jgi:hypothetical protein
LSQERPYSMNVATSVYRKGSMVTRAITYTMGLHVLSSAVFLHAASYCPRMRVR